MTKRRACLLASWAFFYELSVKLPEEDEDYKDNPVVFPPEEAYAGQETYKYLGEEGDKRYNDEWIQVKVW